MRESDRAETIITHHNLVVKRMDVGNVAIPPGHNIDHINWQKTDNRRENLRVVPYSDQNVNRPERSDKVPPPSDLRALGIVSLPRRIRWDVTERKFVIDLPDGGTISGTKSVAVTVVNKFRDCAKKLAAHLRLAGLADTPEEFATQRAGLADEHNQLVRAAHLAAPDVFPDGPYVDPSDLIGPLSYVEFCLGKLPPVAESEVEHGALSVESRVVDLPDIDAVAIVRPGAVVLFDRAHSGIVKRLPAFDVSTNCFNNSPLLREVFPAVDLGVIALAKGKIPAKDLVWHAILGRPIAAGHCIVPLNYKQLDLRTANLQMLPGTGKNYKSVDIEPVPLGIDVGMRFWPRGVVLGKAPEGSQAPRYTKSPLTFNVKITGEPAFKPTCSVETAPSIFRSKIVPRLVQADPGWDASNAAFQRLHGQYVDCVELLL